MIGFLLFPLVACVALLVFPTGYPGVARFGCCWTAQSSARALFVVAWVTLLRDVYAATGVSGVDAVCVDRLSDRGGRDRHRGGHGARPRERTRWRQTMTLLTMGLTLIAAVRRRLRVPVCPHIATWDSPWVWAGRQGWCCWASLRSTVRRIRPRRRPSDRRCCPSRRRCGCLTFRWPSPVASNSPISVAPSIPTPRSSWCRGWLSRCWPANSWWSPRTGGCCTACPTVHCATP